MWLAQTLALTPVAYLVLVGVVEGISPRLEEAAQTLRASRYRTFVTVTLPLMAPGLLNAFLLVFIESLADFGNPLLLGGNLEVLSVAIYLRDRRRAAGPGRAAILAIVLLGLSLGAVPAPAPAARAPQLRHDSRQGRRRQARCRCPHRGALSPR